MVLTLTGWLVGCVVSNWTRWKWTEKSANEFCRTNRFDVSSHRRPRRLSFFFAPPLAPAGFSPGNTSGSAGDGGKRFILHHYGCSAKLATGARQEKNEPTKKKKKKKTVILLLFIIGEIFHFFPFRIEMIKFNGHSILLKKKTYACQRKKSVVRLLLYTVFQLSRYGKWATEVIKSVMCYRTPTCTVATKQSLYLRVFGNFTYSIIE